MIFCRPSTKVIEFLDLVIQVCMIMSCIDNAIYLGTILLVAPNFQVFRLTILYQFKNFYPRLTYDLCLISIFAITLIEVF